MENKPRFGILFDKDGVITDNNAWHKKAWYIFLEKYDLKISEDEFATKIYGRTNEEIIDEMWPIKLPYSEREVLGEEKEAIFRKIYLPDFILTTGLSEFLELMKQADVPMAVATNAPLSNLDFTLDAGNLRTFFKAAVYAKEAGNPKPAPDVYLKAAEGIEIKPQLCVVFEDSLTGIKAARAAGCKVIAITTTYPREALIPVSDLVIDTFFEVNYNTLEALFS